jgi:hypothetical protein
MSRAQDGRVSDDGWSLEQASDLLRKSSWTLEISVQILTGRLTQHPYVVGRRPAADSNTVPLQLPATYLVRWESAEKVRRAFARLEELNENALASFLSRPPEDPGLDSDHYVVTVKALEPPQPSSYELLSRFLPAELIARTELKSSQGRTVKPTRAIRSGVGASAAVHFYFPRRTKEVPLLTARDDWAVFTFTGRNGNKLKARFKKDAIR